MSIITQRKAKKISSTSVEQSKLDKLTRQYKAIKAELNAILEQAKPLQAELAEVEAKLLAEADDVMEPSEKQVVNGVEIGAKGKQVSVTDNIKVAELLTKQSPTLFFELAKPGLTELRKYLTPDELKQCTKTEHSRKRVIKVK